MSFLKPAGPRANANFAQESEERHLISPESSNIWQAGTKHLAPKSDEKYMAGSLLSSTLHPTVRSGHQELHPGRSVESYFRFVPSPTGLSLHPNLGGLESSNKQHLAIKELGEYAEGLMDHMHLTRTQELAHPEVQSYAAREMYKPHGSIETIADTMREHNLCLKATVSDSHLGFSPFCTKITADDLTNCMLHTNALQTSGVTSKFLKCTSKASPDSLFFHLIQDKNSGQHSFYSVNYTKRDRFQH